MKKYAAGGAKPKAKAKTAAELKAEGLALKKKGQAMKTIGKAMKPMTAGEAAKRIVDTGYNVGKAGLKTAAKAAYYTSPYGIAKETGKVLKEAMYPTNVTNNMGTNTKINTNSKGTATRRVTDAKGNTTTKVRTASGKEYVKVKNAKGQEYKTPTPAKKKTATVTPKPEPKKPETKKVEAKKVETKKSSSTTSKSAESPVSSVLSSAIAKSNPTAPKISSNTRTMMDNLSKSSSSTSAPTKQKFGARVKAKVAEAVTNRRQKRLTKLKGKLGQMKMGGSKKSC